jgi:hypothetical protein
LGLDSGWILPLNPESQNSPLLTKFLLFLVM